ncbi:DNA binding domain-containing protein, excisionase family [Sphingopyxis sp. YR583]|uniref:excisionase family DNA-binding protein n=1 Tax=Sphingopyxis sp. YR583 TaxID=1881047 RepID=UPI0008A80885|nr:excisionase family DNA-binding protein [Sphingopyxis sp. YR583]SEH13025.1 DNA binding domain-containing protein, excisionase family [Sphingopyxis sp. YR583]
MTARWTRSLSPLAAADRLGLSRADLVALLDDGTLASHFEGWHRRIARSDVEALAATREEVGPGAPERRKPFADCA